MIDVQFNESFDVTGRAQLKQVFEAEMPISPPDVSGWVTYVGNAPDFAFAPSAPFELAGIQVWKALKPKSAIEKMW